MTTIALDDCIVCNASFARPCVGDGLLRRRLLLGDCAAAAELRLRARAEQGGGRRSLRLLRGRDADLLVAGRPAGRPHRAAPHGHRRAAAARMLQRRLRLRRAVPPARRSPVCPGRLRCADLVGSADLADHGGAARAPWRGDRHRPGHRRRRRPPRPGAGRAGGRGRHRSGLQRRARSGDRPRRPRRAHARDQGLRAARACARSPRRSSAVRSSPEPRSSRSPR